MMVKPNQPMLFEREVVNFPGSITLGSEAAKAASGIFGVPRFSRSRGGKMLHRAIAPNKSAIFCIIYKALTQIFLGEKRNVSHIEPSMFGFGKGLVGASNADQPDNLTPFKNRRNMCIGVGGFMRGQLASV